MASRKEELLSRLRNTLAIVQATRYDNMLSGDGSGIQGAGNQAGSGESRSYSPVNEDSLYSSVASHGTPASGLRPSRSSGPSVDDRWLDYNSGGSPWSSVIDQSPSQHNRPAPITGIPSFGNIDDVDDEDEFLYGSSPSNKELTKPSEADMLLSYIPVERNSDRDFKSYTSTYSSSSGYQQQATGSVGDQGPRVSDMTSDILKNVLRLVSQQSPDTSRHSDSPRDRMSYVDSSFGHRSQSRVLSGQSSYPQHEDPVRTIVSEAQNVCGSQQPAALTQSYGHWSDLKLNLGSFQGQQPQESPSVQLPSRAMQLSGSSSLDESSMRMPSESSDLGSTVDRILQTINLDVDLRKLMQEKLKKEDCGKLVKEEQERKRQASLERMKLEEENARKEAGEHEKVQLDEQNKLLAERLIQGLLKAKDNAEIASQQNPLMDLITKTVGFEQETKPIPSVVNRKSSDVGDEGKTDSASTQVKNYPLQFVPRSTQLGKQKDADISRLIVTSGSLLKPEIDSAPVVKPESESTKHRSGIDSSWEQSTEEFLRKLNRRDDIKGDGKRARNQQEEQSSSRMSRERGNDRQSARSSDRKSRTSRESISSGSESDNSKDRKSGGKSKKSFEKGFSQLSRHSKSPLTMIDRIQVAESSNAQVTLKPDATIRKSVKPADKLVVAGEEVTKLTVVQEKRSERSKDQMKADIEALQAELANLQKINTGLRHTGPSQPMPSAARKVETDKAVQIVVVGLPAPTVDQKITDSHANCQPKEVPVIQKVTGVDETSCWPKETPSVGQKMMVDDAVSRPKESSGDQNINCDKTVVKPKLTKAQIRKLESSKAEMLANINVLLQELEKLEQVQGALLLRAACKERDIQLQENKQMQSEIEDHLWALHKATKELTEQYLQGDQSEDALPESKTSVSTAPPAVTSASLIVPESKGFIATSESMIASTVSLVTSSTASVSSPRPKAVIPTLTDTLTSTSDSQKTISTTSKVSENLLFFSWLT